jgi:hypothetical protein
MSLDIGRAVELAAVQGYKGAISPFLHQPTARPARKKMMITFPPFPFILLNII